MSIQLWNEMKLMRAQILGLVQRIESLEESREADRKRRPTITMPPKTPDLAEYTKLRAGNGSK